MQETRVLTILQTHLPPETVLYCFRLWQNSPFDLRLRKERLSKVGDFTHRPGKTPRITINRDSHPFLFLITYVHEVAHLMVHRQHGWKVKAHGLVWKQAFQGLMAPLLHEQIFPQELLKALKKHMRNPKASSFSDTELSRQLRALDLTRPPDTLLSDIAEGETFSFRGRLFRKGNTRRTRALCHGIKSRSNYLIPLDAVIERVL